MNYGTPKEQTSGLTLNHPPDQSIQRWILQKKKKEPYL
jgi:hypothetical protein